MKRATLQALLRHRLEKRAVVLVTELASGAQSLLDPFETRSDGSDSSDIPEELRAAARRAAERDRSELCEIGGRELLLRAWNPDLRMVIVGAVHIAQSLWRFASMTGFDVTLIDPRRSFATPERFPGAGLVHAWPERALSELAIDRRCALVTLSHDPKLDDPALASGLRAGAFYVGALGSRRTHQKRLERMRELGFAPEQVARIKGPVGLAIGAMTPAEIATSIMAEVIQELRRGAA